MKKVLTKLKDGAIMGVGFLLILGAVHAWNGLQADPGDALTSAKWNELVDKVDTLEQNAYTLSGFTLNNLKGPYNNTESTSSESILTIDEAGIYMINASYRCRSTSSGDGRYPVERYYVNGTEVSMAYGEKICSNASYANRYTHISHPIILSLNSGDELKYYVSGWSVNYYKSSRVYASKIFNK